MTIKELRQITGLSQKAFGEKYHITKRSIENWEGGQRKPSETILYLLERAVKEDYKMTREKMIQILMADRYTKKEAEKAIATKGFEIYDDLSQAAEDFGMTVEEIKEVEETGLRAVEFEGKTYIICYPM